MAKRLCELALQIMSMISLELFAFNVLGDLSKLLACHSQPCSLALAHSPSTTTFLVLMETLTPSGISSSSSEWLLRNCQSSSMHSADCAIWRVELGWECVLCPELCVCNRAVRRFETRDRKRDVHVLHLEGCCGLAVTTEGCCRFGDIEVQTVGDRRGKTRATESCC